MQMGERSWRHFGHNRAKAALRHGILSPFSSTHFTALLRRTILDDYLPKYEDPPGRETPLDKVHP